MTRTLIIVELAVGAAAWAVFLLDYVRTQWYRSPTSRQIMAAGAAAFAEFVSLLVFALRVPVPPWVFTVVFGALALVPIGWVVLRWRARRAERQILP